MGKYAWYANGRVDEVPIISDHYTRDGDDMYCPIAYLSLPPPPISLVKELGAAIRMGDTLPNSTASLEARVQRRALVVAVRCEGDLRSVGQSLFLPDSMVDALRVYRMLLSRGYQAQNIRVLTEDYGSRSSPTKSNIIDSLEWLVANTEPGDYRYFHFSGHGQAYEDESGKGKVARVGPVRPDTTGITRLLARNEQLGSCPRPTQGQTELYDDSTSLHSMPGVGSTRPITHYREALLAQWNNPTLAERLLSSGAKEYTYSRIDDEELNAVLAKLPKGSTLTMTLDCVHGTRINNAGFPRFGGRLLEAFYAQLVDPKPVSVIPLPPDIYSNTSPHNLFVPPTFYLHSEDYMDPNVTMEWVQGPDPLHDIKATVFAWSGFSTQSAHAGDFISAFTSVAEGISKDASHLDMLRDVSRTIREAPFTTGNHVYQFVQLWASCDGSNHDAEESMNDLFVI